MLEAENLKNDLNYIEINKKNNKKSYFLMIFFYKQIYT